MAKVISVNREPVPTEFNSVTLELSYAEARILRDMCARVGGNAITTRRRYTEAIGDVLNEVMGFGDAADRMDIPGCINFKEK